ncbi:MAG: hypothetical protein IKZ09_12890, partial [Clostridia bacterium]|nr:hypothetical protein [Clostridia bacterium]
MKPSVYHDCPIQTADVSRADEWLQAYPRPSLRREDHTCRILSDWQLSCINETTDTHTPLGKIRLPFPPESPLSNIGMTLEAGEAWLYECTFSVNAQDRAGRVLLHLPPTDQMCIVTLSDHECKEQITFPCPTTLDITDHTADGVNHLSVLVRDPLDFDIPYGKQCKKRGGMWYTPTSGMRGMPWIECVPKDYIRNLRITPTLDAVTIALDGCETQSKTLVYETESGTQTAIFDGNRVTIHIPNPHHWTPDDPSVYRFTLACGEDRISSYFALRKVTTETVNGVPVLCLNGKPHWFHGLLDQGYDPDGIDLPATPNGYRRDIEAA